MKHTPGPWAAYFEHGIKADAYRIKANNGEWTVCMGPNWFEEHAEENMANAHLIAAAPDLLGAGKLLIAADDEINEGARQTARAIGMEKLCAAIAKAKGETP